MSVGRPAEGEGFGPDDANADSRSVHDRQALPRAPAGFEPATFVGHDPDVTTERHRTASSSFRVLDGRPPRGGGLIPPMSSDGSGQVVGKSWYAPPAYLAFRRICQRRRP
jgi:hypothetical protein